MENETQTTNNNKDELLEEILDPAYLLTHYFSMFKDMLWKDDYYRTSKPNLPQDN